MLDKNDRKYIKETIEKTVPKIIEETVPQIVADTLRLVLVNYPTKWDLEDRLVEFRSEILNHIDAVMSEVKAMRKDFAILNHRSANNRDLVENHENRIGILEDKLVVN